MNKFYTVNANSKQSTAGVHVARNEEERQKKVVALKARGCDIVETCENEEELIELLRKYKRPLELRRAIALTIVSHVTDEQQTTEKPKAAPKAAPKAKGK